MNYPERKPNPKVAMVPAICPLYRLPIWGKMAISETIDVDFFLEIENNIDNIKYIPKTVLDSKFKWHRIRNRYYGNILWQKGAMKIPFMNYNTIVYSGNIRCISTWLSSILARISGKQVYFWSHGVYGKENKITLVIKRIFFAIPNGNFFYGNLALKKVLSWNFDKDENHVIYNSLNYDFHKKMRSQKTDEMIYESHFKNNNPVLLFIGRLTKIKKLDQLLSAADMLQNKGDYYNLIFIGEGPEKQSLEKMAKKLALNFWFYGACYDESILHGLIQKADLCVSPGNVGLTLIHCLSYGTPVITHGNFDFQMPEAEAIIPGFNGDLFEQDSAESLSKKITGWFVKTKEVGRETIKKNCYLVVDEKYNPNFQVNLIEKVITRKTSN